MNDCVNVYGDACQRVTEWTPQNVAGFVFFVFVALMLIKHWRSQD